MIISGKSTHLFIQSRGEKDGTLGGTKKVCDQIDRMKEEMVRTLQALVRIPSVVGHEEEAQKFMEKLYRSLGLKVICLAPDLEKVKHHPAFIDTGMPYEGRKNVIGLLPGESASPSLILNGHVDVVSPEPIQAWTHHPWAAEIQGERMYGRGAGDMKAGLLANFFALKGILAAGLRPKGMVMLQSVIDEEAGGGGGTLACLIEGHRADAMICTEPHDLKITIAHVGINYFRVRVREKRVTPDWPTWGSMPSVRCFPSTRPSSTSTKNAAGKFIFLCLRRAPEDLAI